MVGIEGLKVDLERLQVENETKGKGSRIEQRGRRKGKIEMPSGEMGIEMWRRKGKWSRIQGIGDEDTRQRAGALLRYPTEIRTPHPSSSCSSTRTEVTCCRLAS